VYNNASNVNKDWYLNTVTLSIGTFLYILFIKNRNMYQFLSLQFQTYILLDKASLCFSNSLVRWTHNKDSLCFSKSLVRWNHHKDSLCFSNSLVRWTHNKDSLCFSKSLVRWNHPKVSLFLRALPQPFPDFRSPKAQLAVTFTFQVIANKTLT
jgi:hypothetical protein